MFAALILILVVLIIWFMPNYEMFESVFGGRDMSSDCPKMASEGDCESNPVRMLWQCAKSCSTCHLDDYQKASLRDENLSICKDFRPNCSRMSKIECNEPSIQLRCKVCV